LGIDDAYFAQEAIDTIVNHILSLYGAKVAAFARNDTNFGIRLDLEQADHAVYIDTSEPGVSNLSGPQYEQRYLLPSHPTHPTSPHSSSNPRSSPPFSPSAANVACLSADD